MLAGTGRRPHGRTPRLGAGGDLQPGIEGEVTAGVEGRERPGLSGLQEVDLDSTGREIPTPPQSEEKLWPMSRNVFPAAARAGLARTEGEGQPKVPSSSIAADAPAACEGAPAFCLARSCEAPISGRAADPPASELV